jgi:AcrR family transcriptional regulator
MIYDAIREMIMVARAREDLLAAGLAVFDRDGFEGATVAAIRSRARTSNGSFFHFFGSKKELAGTLFLEVLRRYHAAVLARRSTLAPTPRTASAV